MEAMRKTPADYDSQGWKGQPGAESKGCQRCKGSRVAEERDQAVADAAAEARKQGDAEAWWWRNLKQILLQVERSRCSAAARTAAQVAEQRAESAERRDAETERGQERGYVLHVRRLHVDCVRDGVGREGRACSRCRGTLRDTRDI